ncbi:hypothetical protein [Mycobacterium tilburgii]|uniref:hypothetical protein n=1 Tax=Mycobacterium tilburgii TaxID=44467 RepID=UPI0011820288|nr:hypothetical protein [Mycobacterium tilburgii]
MAESVITEHEKFLEAVVQTETGAFNLLALQAPVATELRAVFGNLQNVADADRMDVLVLHVAQTARRRHPAHAITDESPSADDVDRVQRRLEAIGWPSFEPDRPSV